MNLQSMKSVVYALLGDPSEDVLKFGTVVRYLNLGQQVLGSLLWNYDRDKFLAIEKQTSTAGTADYNTPANMRELVRVRYAGLDCVALAARDINAVDFNELYSPRKGSSQFYFEYGGALPGRTRIRLYPSPDDTVADSIEQWYYQRPTNFHEQGTALGKATGGSTLTIVDAVLAFNTTGKAVPNFWLNAEVRMTSGSNDGIYRRVKTQDEASSTLTLDVALPTAVANAHTYEIAQVSTLPEHVHHLICYYAAALSAPLVKRDPSEFWMVWNGELDGLRSRQVANVDARIPGEVSQGIDRKVIA